MAKSASSKPSRSAAKRRSLSTRFFANRTMVSLAGFIVVFGGVGAYLLGTSHAANTTLLATWQAESTVIQHPERKDKKPISHNGGTAVSGAWRSDPAFNGLQYAMWGPYTTDSTSSCGVFCYDDSKTAQFYLRSANSSSAVVKIEVHANAANRTDSRIVGVAPGGYVPYNVDFSLSNYNDCDIISPNLCAGPHYTVVDLEFRVMVLVGRVDIDKVLLYR